VRLPSGGK